MVDEKKTVRIQRVGLVSTMFLGLMFHELYKSTGIPFLALISPVNESKWEHWKMAYSPMVIVGMLEFIMMKRIDWKLPNYLFSLAGAVVMFEMTTFGLIEVYEVIFGKSHLGVHVSAFFIGALAGHRSKYWILKHIKSNPILNVMGVAFLVTQFVVFTFFTYIPPRSTYFKDSIHETYGIRGEQ